MHGAGRDGGGGPGGARAAGSWPVGSLPHPLGMQQKGSGVQGAGGAGRQQAAAGQGGTFRRSPGSSRSIAGSQGWLGGNGWEGRRKRALAFCCPLLREPGSASVLPRCRRQLPAPPCQPGSARTNARQRLRGMPPRVPPAKPLAVKPLRGVWGSATSGGSCLSKGTKSKREPSHRLGISAPWSWGVTAAPSLRRGGREEPEPGKRWGLPHVPAAARSPPAPLQPRAAFRGAPSPQDPDSQPPAPPRGNSWHEGAGQVWPRDMAEG